MKTYQSYKPSGVEWIGDIPVNWNLIKLKHEYKIQKGRIPKTINEKEEKGSVPYLSMEVLRGSESLSYVSKEDGVFVKEGQILILWDGSNSGEIIKVVKEGIMSSTMGVLNKIGDKLHQDFSFYQLKSLEPEIRNNTNGMGIPHVDGQYIRSLVLLTPPLHEQQQIVKYLDDKTSIIDKLISTKERKIELLKEQRSSLINEVITKGLDPNVKMKDSGVEWIGEIPEGWGVSGFTRFVNIRHGFQFREFDFTDEGIKVVKITQLDRNGYLNLDNCSFINLDRIDEFERILIKENDILMCLTGGTIGKIIKVGKVDEPIVQNYRVGHFSSLNNQIKNDFIFWFMSSHFLTSQIFYEIRENGQPNIGIEDFRKMKITIPPLKEQKQIVDYLDKHTKEIDDLVQLEQKKIELLKEYRQSLISEVITGKIKVVE